VKPLLIVGAGGFGREIAETVAAINSVLPTWELLGFLDDSPHLAGREVDGVPVVGTVQSARRFPSASFVVSVGSPSNYFNRRRIAAILGLGPDRYATLIHPTASLARSTTIGPGSVVLAMVVATASVRLGAHVAVMPHVVFTHDDVVGDFATLGAGARLAGGVTVGEGAYIGSGALVRENVGIGDWALVGMGSVVTRDVPRAQVWAGVPSRFVRIVDVPADLSLRPSLRPPLRRQHDSGSAG